MNKKLSKYGNSLALILDKPLLELLNIKEDTILKISTDGTIITITPLSQNNSEEEISENTQKTLERIMKKYAPALRKLAKN